MMRALTVRQPWAGAMFIGEGAKRVENRTWNTTMRGTVLIHAGKAIDMDAPAGLSPLFYSPMEVRGAILGTVKITDSHLEGDACTDACSEVIPGTVTRWAQRATYADPRPIYHWVLDEASLFVTPIPCKGALQWWEPDYSTQYLVDLAIAERAAR